jgi:hypothetical protein
MSTIDAASLANAPAARGAKGRRHILMGHMFENVIYIWVVLKVACNVETKVKIVGNKGRWYDVPTHLHLLPAEIKSHENLNAGSKFIQVQNAVYWLKPYG